MDGFICGFSSSIFGVCGVAWCPGGEQAAPAVQHKGQSWHQAVLLLFKISVHFCVLCKIHKYVPNSPSLLICSFHRKVSHHLKLMQKADLGHREIPSSLPGAVRMLCVQLVLYACAVIWGETGTEGLNFTSIDHRGREKKMWRKVSVVQDNSLAQGWAVLLFQLLAVGLWAIWCLWDASGLPVLCVSVLKLHTFQPSSSHCLHSSSLPGFLHSGARRLKQVPCRVWVQLAGGTARPLPQPGWTGEQGFVSGVLQSYWPAAVSAFSSGMRFALLPWPCHCLCRDCDKHLVALSLYRWLCPLAERAIQ